MMGATVNQIILAKLDSVQRILLSLVKKVDKIMALADDLKASIAKLDAETTAIAAVITDLVSKLKAGTLTDAEKAEVFTQLEAVSAKLTTLGTDPLNPVP